MNFADSSSVCPALAVLQPLTSVAGTVTFIKSSMTWCLDKIACFSDRKQEIDESAAEFAKRKCQQLSQDVTTESESFETLGKTISAEF